MIKKIKRIATALLSTILLVASINFVGCNQNNTRTEGKKERPIVSAERTIYQGKDTGEVLHNPLMGWSYYAMPWEIIRYGIPDEFDVGYILCSWDQIEKTQGVFDFDLVTRAVERLRHDGKTVYLRLYLMPDNVWDIAGYPAWVKSVEGVGQFTEVTTGMNSEELQWSYKFSHPDYLNKVYQGLVENFLREVKKEYGDGEVDIIDLRAYGLYGEWDSDWGNYWTNMGGDYKEKKTQALNDFVDIYKRVFSDFELTKIAINIPSSTFSTEAEHEAYKKEGAYDNAMESGFAIRYDAFDNYIPDSLFAKRLIAANFPSAPVFGETNYGWNLDLLVVEQVLANMGKLRANIATFGFYKGNYQHAITYNPNFFTDTLKPHPQRTVIGYRILPTVISYNSEANVDGKLHFTSQWENVGAGVLYRHYSLGVSLVDENGKEVYFAVRDDFDITTLIKESEPYQYTTSFNLPGEDVLAPGEYSVRIALVDKNNNYKSSIAMPIAGNDGNLNYEIGKITLK